MIDGNAGQYAEQNRSHTAAEPGLFTGDRQDGTNEEKGERDKQRDVAQHNPLSASEQDRQAARFRQKRQPEQQRRDDE
jgi:hypothetical protein